MYDNIGSKLKTLAVVMGIIQAVGLFVVGVVILADGGGVGVLVILLGPLVAWMTTWALYALGQIADDVRAVKNQNAAIIKNYKDTQIVAQEKIGEALVRLMKETRKEVEAEHQVEVKAKNSEESWTDTASFTVGENETVVCSQCNCRQPSKRKVCWNCGAKFES